MTLIKKFVVESKPLNALLIGVQGAGKSTSCGSLLRKPTLLIFSQKSESHSPTNVIKGCSLFKDAKPENLFAVPFDYIDGKELSPDEAIQNIFNIIEEAKAMPEIESVVFDSLTGISELIMKTKRFDTLTRSPNGARNNFAYAGAATTIYTELIEKLQELNVVGKRLVVLLGGKQVGVDQVTNEVISISPTLPFFGVAESLCFKFPTILPIIQKTNPYGKTCFDLGLNVEKKIKSREDGSVTKFMNFHPRLDMVSIAEQAFVDILPPDLFYIKEYAEKVAKANKQSLTEAKG